MSLFATPLRQDEPELFLPSDLDLNLEKFVCTYLESRKKSINEAMKPPDSRSSSPAFLLFSLHSKRRYLSLDFVPVPSPRVEEFFLKGKSKLLSILPEILCSQYRHEEIQPKVPFTFLYVLDKLSSHLEYEYKSY